MNDVMVYLYSSSYINSSPPSTDLRLHISHHVVILDLFLLARNVMFLLIRAQGLIIIKDRYLSRF